MIKTVRKFFRDILTEANGTEFDAKRVAGIVGILCFTVLSGVAVIVHKQAVDFVALGSGIGAVIASIGGSIMMGKGGEAVCPPKDE